MKVNWDDEIPDIWENRKWQPNHQPDSTCCCFSMFGPQIPEEYLYQTSALDPPAACLGLDSNTRGAGLGSEAAASAQAAGQAGRQSTMAEAWCPKRVRGVLGLRCDVLGEQKGRKLRSGLTLGIDLLEGFCIAFL